VPGGDQGGDGVSADGAGPAGDEDFQVRTLLIRQCRSCPHTAGVAISGVLTEVHLSSGRLRW
jgi:hypothetical protein